MVEYVRVDVRVGRVQVDDVRYVRDLVSAIKELSPSALELLSGENSDSKSQVKPGM